MNKTGLIAVLVGSALFVASSFYVDVNRSYTFLFGPAVMLCVVFVVFFLPLMRLRSQRRRLLAGGIPAEATVLDVAQTGTTMTIGTRQQFGVLLTLEVRAQGRAP